MSFQGDVGGIGLADLLQSLARGREGILTLATREGLRASLGFQNGAVLLLPEADEDPETWRNRARRAWIKDPEFRIDTLRMTEIARAQRIETLYRLLDSEGVHFRFAPGPLPERSSGPAVQAAESGAERKGASRRDAVIPAPMQVEGLLLEYARLKDEGAAASAHFRASDDVVPIPLAAGSPGLDRFFAECDGASNLVEIADRLGWPLRQARIVVFGELVRGTLRLAVAEEVLSLAVAELLQGHVARSASRLAAWCEAGAPGPADPQTAEALDAEWQAGRLQPALHAMPRRGARTLLRRLDLALGNPLTAVERWSDLAASDPTDALAALRLVVAQVRAAVDPNTPSLRDLLAIARGFADGKCPMRAAAILRIVAARQPESPATRLEIGLGLLAARAVEEAAPWILDAARTFVASNESERALQPLRTLIEACPSHREARRLLSRARAQSVQRTLVAKNSLVTIAVLVALSLGAVVTYRSRAGAEERLAAIRSGADRPHEALALLDEHFAGDGSSEVQELRRLLEARRKELDNQKRTAWSDLYREAQLECTVGDPVLGLERALALPPPPEAAEDEPWPLVSDLYNGLAARLEGLLPAGPEDAEPSPEDARAERKLQALVDELERGLPASASGETKAFAQRLAGLEKRMRDREASRAQARAERGRKDNLQRQDMLLAAARAHGEAGDYVRALDVYAQLVATDPSGKLSELLAKEIGEVEVRAEALVRARELSEQGRHPEAKQALLQGGIDPRAYLMPWRVESLPTGARVRFSDGRVRETPFTTESSFGERLEIVVEAEGCDPLELVVQEPRDLRLRLSRTPERSWPSTGRVEAPPVAVGDDHVVCDRRGEVARIGKAGAVVWRVALPSLGGIARAPAFLPRRPGSLLVLSEDGDAWVVDAATGAADGPWSAGSPPVEGPIATEKGVRARFRDGTLAIWDARLRPETSGTGGATLAPEDEAPAPSVGLALLRRAAGAGTSLASPWTELEVEVGAELFEVRARGASTPSFSVRREGEWSYVAWEAPHARMPRGRLWIADGRGLRSFAP